MGHARFRLIPGDQVHCLISEAELFLLPYKEGTLSTKPWFKCYPSDFLNGVAHLTPNEVALYTIALMEIYDSDGPIPDRIEWLARRCNMRPTTCEKALNGLIDAGKLTRENGFLMNDRCKKSIKSRQKVGEKSKENITQRWNKSQQKHNKNNGGDLFPYENPDTDAIPTRSQSLDTRKKERKYSVGFLKLWEIWIPHNVPKGSKASAGTEWERHIEKPGVDETMVIEQAKAYCEECGRTDTSTCHVERWIKKHRWEDERLSAAPRRPMTQGEIAG